MTTRIIDCIHCEVTFEDVDIRNIECYGYAAHIHVHALCARTLCVTDRFSYLCILCLIIMFVGVNYERRKHYMTRGACCLLHKISVVDSKIVIIDSPPLTEFYRVYWRAGCSNNGMYVFMRCGIVVSLAW